jgi:hypothetical protein
LPTSWLPAEVNGDKKLDTGPAQSRDEAPPGHEQQEPSAAVAVF